MRIIAGERKGAVLQSPKGDQTRPTLGRVRESLFSILQGDLAEAHVADLYAGAGGLGLEALSRGAARCVFVDKARLALDALRGNITKLRYEERALVVPKDVGLWLKSSPQLPAPLDLVFLDPPYGATDFAKIIQDCGTFLPLKPSALLIAQCSVRDELLESIGLFHRYRLQIYGETALHFFSFLSEKGES